MSDSIPSSAKKGILYIIDSSRIGGAEAYFARLARSIDRDKFRPVLVIPTELGHGVIFDNCDCKIYRLNTKHLMNIKALRDILKIVKEEKIEIIHSTLYTSDLVAAIVSKMSGATFVSSVVGFNFLILDNKGLGKIKKIIESLLYRIVYIFASRIIAVSRSVKLDLVNRTGINVSEKKIDLIYCGVDDNAHTKYKDTTGFGNAGPSIVCVGTLDPVKGHKYLLEAVPILLEKFSALKVILIGDGIERDRLKKIVSTLHIEDGVQFTGYVNDDEKEAMLSGADILVLPSLSEGCPTVLLEAMRSAKPIVATDVGGVRELVTEGINGIIVPPRDHRRLASAIEEILSNRDLALGLGRKGREMFKSMFTTSVMVRAHEKIYESF